MRTLFFALMIALLLLRGWVGDAMTNSMALAPLQPSHPASELRQLAVKTAATAAAHTADEAAHPTAHPTAPDAAPDCAGHATANDDAAATHCQSCDACQACHSVALTPPAASPSAAFNPRAQPPAKAARFASADAVPGQKPPIS